MRTAVSIASGSASTSTFARCSTVSTHSVEGRIVTHGTRYQYASFWRPPESVVMTRAWEAADANAAEWVRIAARIKQLDPASPLVGEEWVSGPYALIGYAQALQETLKRLADGAPVLAGYDVGQAPGGRLAVRVLPHGTFDRLLLNGFHAEVWTKPGVTEERLHGDAGLGQRAPRRTNGVALVLGAGNIFSIPPLDVLYQLYAGNRTVVLKLNPVTDPLLPVFRAVFQPMIDRDLVEIVGGGPEAGSALAHHPGVTAVHMTGSEATHDAIVWGGGEEAAAAKAAGTLKLRKPMTSELGGVCPIIVVPGKWSAADLRHQAEHVATQRLHNSGCNCIAGQILIISSDWAQKDHFLTELRRALRGRTSLVVVDGVDALDAAERDQAAALLRDARAALRARSDDGSGAGLTVVATARTDGPALALLSDARRPDVTALTLRAGAASASPLTEVTA